MRRFKCIVEGRNFDIEMEGVLQKLGFMTTVFVETEDSNEIEKLAIELVRRRQDLREMTQNPENDSPMLYLEVVEEIELEGELPVAEGYTFYTEDDPEEPRWWEFWKR